MDPCEPIEFKSSSGERTAPWQYSDSQRIGTNDLLSAYAILDEDVISESTVADTLAAKWWVNQIPSGLPYENYLRELYYEEWHTSAIPDQKVEEEMAARENLMRAQRLVYVGLSGTPVGSVSGDPMLDPNWTWKDNRTPINGLGTIPCDGAFYPSSIFCQLPWPDNTKTIDTISSATSAANKEKEELEEEEDDVLNTIHSISADFLTSARELINQYKEILDPSNYPSEASGLADVQKLIDSAEKQMLEAFESLVELDAAISETETNINKADYEIDTLMPPQELSFVANLPAARSNAPTMSTELALEPAEPLPGTPPKPHVRMKVNWWQWIMAILIIILNKITTTMVAWIGIIIPMHNASGILNAVPPPTEAKIDPTAASLESVGAICAELHAAGAALGAAWFVDIPIPWIYPPLLFPSSSVNIQGSKSESFFDPEPGEFEDASVDYAPSASETPELEDNSVDYTQSANESPETGIDDFEAQLLNIKIPHINQSNIRNAINAAMEDEKAVVKRIYEKYGCSASLWLLERYG